MAEKTLRDFWRILFRRWPLFLVMAAIGALAVLVVAHFQPLKYTGVTTMNRRMDPATEGSGTDFRQMKLTLDNDLAGYRAVERVVDDASLGLTRGMPRGADGALTHEGNVAKQQLVNTMRAGIKVNWTVKTELVDLISVSFTSDDPALAQKVPDMLVKNYINEAKAETVSRLTASQGFMTQQVANAQKRLEEIRQQRIEFEKQNAGRLPDDISDIKLQIDQIMSEMGSLRRQQELAKKRLALLQEGGSGMTTDESAAPIQVKGPNPRIAQLEDDIRRYKNILDDAMTLQRMTENHPTVVNYRKKIEQMEVELEKVRKEEPLVVIQEVTGAAQSPNDRRMQALMLQSEIEMTTSELARLQGRLTPLQEVMADFGPKRQEYERLLRKELEQQEEVNSWQRKLKEIEMSLAPEVAQKRTYLDVEQFALQQIRPSSPSPNMVLGGALVASLAVGVGMVFLANLRDRSITVTEDAAKYFSIPVQGVIGEIYTPGQKVRKVVRMWVVGPLVGVVLCVALGVATMSIVLKLYYPDQFRRWKEAPVAFVYRHATEQANEIMHRP